MAETPSQDTWMEWFKNFLLLSIPITITFWKLIDSYFAAQSKKDREYIKSVVQESMHELREDIKEIKATLEQDRKDNRKEIMDLTREINKRP